MAPWAGGGRGGGQKRIRGGGGEGGWVGGGVAVLHNPNHQGPVQDPHHQW